MMMLHDHKRNKRRVRHRPGPRGRCTDPILTLDPDQTLYLAPILPLTDPGAGGRSGREGRRGAGGFDGRRGGRCDDADPRQPRDDPAALVGNSEFFCNHHTPLDTGQGVESCHGRGFLTWNKARRLLRNTSPLRVSWRQSASHALAFHRVLCMLWIAGGAEIEPLHHDSSRLCAWTGRKLSPCVPLCASQGCSHRTKHVNQRAAVSTVITRCCHLLGVTSDDTNAFRHLKQCMVMRL